MLNGTSCALFTLVLAGTDWIYLQPQDRPLRQHQILPNIYKIYYLRLVFLPFVVPILTDEFVNYFMKRIFLHFPRNLMIFFYLKYLLSNNNVDISRPKQLMSPCIKL